MSKKVEEKKETVEKATKETKAKAKKSAPKVEEPKVEEPKRVVTRQDVVEITSNTTGTVVFHSAHGRPIRFDRVGQRRDVLVDDLEQLMAVSPGMLEDGTVIIEDKDVIDFLGLTDVYNSGRIIKYADLEDVLSKTPEELEKILNKVSASTRDDLARLAMKHADKMTVLKIRLFRGHGIYIPID